MSTPIGIILLGIITNVSTPSVSTCSYIRGNKILSPIVKTPLGIIRGQTEHFNDIAVDTFQGIPYAQPPVGDLRFRKPLPIDPWADVFVADDFAASCLQIDAVPFFSLVDKHPKSEDCLYLNIWVPNNSKLDKKAVMIWIHGGGFQLGSSLQTYTQGTVLSAVGNVVFVSLNYRIGPMGFLYAGTDNAPGNVGLYDMLEALKWVNNNIECFGGDKNKITLFGESAGGFAIGALIASPLTKGLFSKAIIESYSVRRQIDKDNTADLVLTKLLAQNVGCFSNNNTTDLEEMVNCLKDKNSDYLLKTLSKMSNTKSLKFLPRYGDEILPHPVLKAISDDSFNNINVLIGVNLDEGSSLLPQSIKSGYYGKELPQFNISYAVNILKSYLKYYPNTDDIFHYYLNGIDENDKDKIRYQVYTALGDFDRLCPSVYLADKLSDRTDKVHFYLYEHRSFNSLFAPWMGVAHTEEIQFVFGYPLLHPENYTHEEILFSNRIIRIWTDFAKIGAPEDWPKYSKNPNSCVSLDIHQKTSCVIPNFENCNFLRLFFDL